MMDVTTIGVGIAIIGILYGVMRNHKQDIDKQLQEHKQDLGTQLQQHKKENKELNTQTLQEMKQLNTQTLQEMRQLNAQTLQEMRQGFTRVNDRIDNLYNLLLGVENKKASSE